MLVSKIGSTFFAGVKNNNPSDKKSVDKYTLERRSDSFERLMDRYDRGHSQGMVASSVSYSHEDSLIDLLDNPNLTDEQRGSIYKALGWK